MRIHYCGIYLWYFPTETVTLLPGKVQLGEACVQSLFPDRHTEDSWTNQHGL